MLPGEINIAKAFAKIQNRMIELGGTAKKEIDFQSGDWMLETSREAIIGWENLKDEEGQIVEFSKEAIDDLDPMFFMELVSLLIKAPLKKEVEKNSEGS